MRNVQRRDDLPNVPSVENFVGRAFHASVKVGDYVYIDGGEVSQFVDGEIISKKINHTLSVDMSKSWTNDSVSIRVIDKGNAPNLNKQLLWPSSDNQTFFAFGGEESYLDHPWLPPEILNWEFRTDGRGGGEWNVFNANSNSVFFNLTRPADGLGGVMDNTGYIFGGYTHSHSSPATVHQQDAIAVPNIVSFNITSGEWNNDTAPDYLERHTGSYGLSHAVPTFGPLGLLLVTGTTLSVTGPDPLSDITLYEPSSKKWYTQTASGDIPAGRDHPCTVGVSGENGTYEIFMYGGYGSKKITGNLTSAQVSQLNAYDAVYVLSLPAFAWFKANYTAVQSRHKHTCEVFGRQMLSIGGWSTTDNNLGHLSTDRFLQGLGIFDLTAMQWSSSYDANAEPYQTPDVVKAWYAANGTSPTRWDDPAVQKFFERASTSNPGSSAGTASESPNPTPTPSSGTTSKSSSSHAGAIAGGVIGGVAALVFVAGSIFWLLRRKRKPDGASGYAVPKEHARPELPVIGAEKPQELPLNCRPQELPLNYRPQELPLNYRPHELPSDYRLPEMEASQPAIPSGK